jgi:hypothetical protein
MQPGPRPSTLDVDDGGEALAAPASSPPTTATDLSFPAHHCYTTGRRSRDLARSGRRRWPFPAWFLTLVASHRWFPRVSVGRSFDLAVYVHGRRVQTYSTPVPLLPHLRVKQFFPLLVNGTTDHS